MNRRAFIVSLAGAAGVPMLEQRVAHAQQQPVLVVGYLNAGGPEAGAYFAAEFRKGLAEAGYIEGRNVAIEFRWAQNDLRRLPDLASDLVQRRVNVIVTPGSVVAARAAKDATKTIPIVFSNAGDPVQSGLVTSLNRPNGNITGISYMSVELGAKRLGLLHELKPDAARFAVLVNPSSVDSRSLSSAVEVAAAAAGWDLQVLSAATTAGIDNAFAQLTETRIAALLVMPNILFGNRRVHLATLAARHAVPTIYPDPQYTEVGGLMSYGTRLVEQYRQLGVYTA